jgi:putative proteasome-type protease
MQLARTRLYWPGRKTQSTVPMTYCVGILVEDGLVMIADTRTNAGLDNIATFRKLNVFEKPGERVIALCTAGNLAAGQAILSLVADGLENPDTGHIETILTVDSMFKAAQFVGRAVREVYRVDGPALEQQAGGFDVTILLGGQVGSGQLRLFMIYSAGNFIEATPDTPYLQTGEHKYGKPILDRAARNDTDLYDALKLGLISMDSTMRSNLSVGMPIDLMVYRRGSLRCELSYRIDENEPYFRDLRNRWSEALQAAHLAIPRPPYTNGNTAPGIRTADKSE